MSIVLILTSCRHMHEDEEIRYILEGGGFFDVHGESYSPLLVVVLAAYPVFFRILLVCTDRKRHQ